MRYQERIYIQNEHQGVRNKDILNVNMSSDICVFGAPLFNLSGASKIDCTGLTTTSYIVTTATEIPLSFVFTANTDSFTANSATFKYEIYKYDTNKNMFVSPPVYQSSILDYSGFSGTNITVQNIPIANLILDGEYLVKGYYEYINCTEFLQRLNKKVDTLMFKTGSQFGLYDSNLDYSFIAINVADEPIFNLNGNNTPLNNALVQENITPTSPNISANTITIVNDFVGDVVVTLNGVVLANGLDYTRNGSVITLNDVLVSSDIITLIYTRGPGQGLVGDTLYITTPIVSGTTNNQGPNTYYYNTTTSKYEIYTSVTPKDGNSILVMLNGVTLADGVDYYQSTSNPKRIILEGNILIGDIITIVYFPRTNVVNGLITNSPIISWNIDNEPKVVNGYFSLEVSSGSTFSNFIHSGFTEYIINQRTYSDTFTASGTIGTILYYRVKNNKDFVTFCGDIVNTTTYSEIIPLTIQTNAINSY